MRWALEFKGSKIGEESPCYKLKVETWTYIPYQVFPRGWKLQHAAVKITTCDGTVFYADDGWWGGEEGIFLPGDIPPYVTPDSGL